MKSLRGYVSLAAALLLTAIPSLAQDRLFVTTANSVAAFDIASGGTLTAGPATTLTATPLAIGACPGKPFVFVVVNNGATNELRSYSVLANGTLTSNGTPASLGLAAVSENLAVDPSCRFVYAISRTRPSVQLVTVNPDGLLGAATGQGVTPGANVGAVSPSGTYLHVLVSGDYPAGAYETYPISSAGIVGSRSNNILDSFDTISELTFADGGIYSIFTYGQKAEGIAGYSVSGGGDLGAGFSAVGDGSRLSAVAAHPSAAFVYAANSNGGFNSIRAYPASLSGFLSETPLLAPTTDLVGYSSNGTTVLFAATADGILSLGVNAGGTTNPPSSTALAGAANLTIVTASVTPPGTLEVTVAIEKGSGTNCVNPKLNGMLPAVITGTPQVAVSQIDVSTLTLAGASPKQCGISGTELKCTFQAKDMSYSNNFDDCGTLPLTGKLIGGADIAGEATICLKKGATCSL